MGRGSAFGHIGKLRTENRFSEWTKEISKELLTFDADGRNCGQLQWEKAFADKKIGVMSEENYRNLSAPVG